jgi:hypothetical protein
MKWQRHLAQPILVIAFLLAGPGALAGPSCDVRPNHPNCTPSTGDPGPVYKVTFSNIKTGAYDDSGSLIEGIFTTPGTLDGDESGLNANGNGPNEVKLQVNDGTANNFLRKFLGTYQEDGLTKYWADLCFSPSSYLNGSIHMADNINSGGDPDRVGYIWVHAKTQTGDDMQYAVDLFDTQGQWSNTFLPQGIDDFTSRSVTHWEVRQTKKKGPASNCVSDSLVEIKTGDDPIVVTIKRVAANPWYANP